MTVAYVADDDIYAALATTSPHTHDEFSCAKFPDGNQSPDSGHGRTTSQLLNL